MKFFWQESNPGLQLEKQAFYPWATAAAHNRGCQIKTNLEGLEVLHPLDGVLVVDDVGLVHGDDERQLRLVEDAARVKHVLKSEGWKVKISVRYKQEHFQVTGMFSSKKGEIVIASNCI